MTSSRSGRHSQPPLHTPEQVTAAIRAMLQENAVSTEDRVQLLASALVIEALQPYWRDGRTPAEAHAALWRGDPELAHTVEAIAPMLLARLECRQEAVAIIQSVEVLLGLRR